jgi:hypothetical protein
MNQIKIYAKALAAALVGALVSVVVNLVNGSTPWPSNGAEWIQFALTTFGPAIAAVFVPNKITQKQLDNDKNVIGGTVVPDAQVPPAGPTPWVP